MSFPPFLAAGKSEKARQDILASISKSLVQNWFLVEGAFCVRVQDFLPGEQRSAAESKRGYVVVESLPKMASKLAGNLALLQPFLLKGHAVADTRRDK